jgi:hypothetical protein
MKATCVVATAAACVLMVFAGPAAAAKPTACTNGNAQGMFQAPLEHIVGNPCQYRLFWDGQTVTFCEDDVILGGIVWFDPYKSEGISRQQSIAGIEAIHDRLWIDGVEQPLMDTAYKDGQSSMYGDVVYQQRGFIGELPVGTHTSYWESVDPVYGLSTATVTVIVLPQSDSACS